MTRGRIRFRWGAGLLLCLTLGSCTTENKPESFIDIQGTQFVDAHERNFVLRSINVGGGSKLPSRPATGSHEKNFLQPEGISFVDRPFPLQEADRHFARIASWGFNSIRLLSTWEAIAHAGPDTVDQDYVEYFTALVDTAAAHNLWVVVDMHQDVWSRFTGGDGAPRWTLETVGFDVDALHDLGATVLHSKSENFPHLLWPTNHLKLAAATMFTLLFAGDRYAPFLQIEGQSAQSYLVDQYISAWMALVRALKDKPNVLGYDIMNEPGTGFLSLETLDRWNSQLTMGAMPSPAQAMFAAQVSQEVPVYTFGGLGFETSASTILNPENKSVWQADAKDLWQQAGVWELKNQRPVLLRTDYFADTTSPMDFINPFYDRVAAAILDLDPDALLFREPLAEHIERMPQTQQSVFAAHWYDAYSLINKNFDPNVNVRRLPSENGDLEIELVIGTAEIAALFVEELAAIRLKGIESGMPSWIGEFGLPFDPYEPEFETRALALDLYYDAMDVLTLSSALWNYVPDNTADYGDGWNREDLSVVSKNHPDGRAIHGFVRPYIEAYHGEVRSVSFDHNTGAYSATVDHLEEGDSLILRVPAQRYAQPKLKLDKGEILETRGDQYVIAASGESTSVTINLADLADLEP